MWYDNYQKYVQLTKIVHTSQDNSAPAGDNHIFLTLNHIHVTILVLPNVNSHIKTILNNFWK